MLQMYIWESMFGYFSFLDQFSVERCSGSMEGLWTSNPEVPSSRLGGGTTIFQKLLKCARKRGEVQRSLRESMKERLVFSFPP